jgi:peroxiredoxin
VPVFDVEENPKNYHNAGVYFANEYFSKLDWKMREMDYMIPLWENVITYTRTLCSMPESFMRQDSIPYYLDKLLAQPKKNSRAYRLTLTGIMRGLLDQQSVMFSQYAEMYAKLYPNEIEVNQQNKQRFTQLKEHEKKQKQWDTGALPPEINLQAIDGKSVSLRSFKGKTVLLYFGGSSFAPSRRLNAQLVYLYRKYQPKGFEIFQVCIEKDKTAWQKSLTEDKVYWTAVSDLRFWDSEVIQTYSVKAIPTTYLLDVEGKIIVKNVLGQDLQSRLESIYQVKK